MELYGNISTDVKLERTESGDAYVNFGVAHNPREFRDGEWKDGVPVFFWVSAWRSLAEGIAGALKKGDPVVVTGKWRARKYQDKEGVEQHSQWIEAEAVGPNLKFVDAALSKRERAPKGGADPVPNPFDQ